MKVTILTKNNFSHITLTGKKDDADVIVNWKDEKPGFPLLGLYWA